MNPETSKTPDNPFAAYRKAVRPFAPIATIWGVQWALDAFLQYIWVWPFHQWVWPATAIPALVASVFVWINNGTAGNGRTFDRFAAVWAVLIIVMSVAAVELLEYAGAFAPLFEPVLRALLVSIGYVVAAKWLGRPLLYLGLWMYALTATVSLWYLGFTAIVTGFFGGLSLIALGWMIRRWNRVS
jgi:hypothetical protein